MLELIQMMETDKDRKNIPACHVCVRPRSVTGLFASGCHLQRMYLRPKNVRCGSVPAAP